MIDDLRHIRITDDSDDGFQILSQEFAAWLFIVGLMAYAVLNP